MNRIKSFNSTGIAPDGVLFSGDLNAIEDAAAALSDLTQNLEVATLALGEIGLLLVRYGAGEARLTGSLRVDSILRGLGGLYAGQYTTAQRDAIAAGSRPYGLIIFNVTLGHLEWNAGTDPAPNWQPVGATGPWTTADIVDAAITTAKLADGSVTVAKLDAAVFTTVVGYGTIAGQPAANTVPAGSLYFAYDIGEWSRSTGVANTWTRLDRPLLTLAQFAALTPYDGMEVYLQVDSANGINWHVRYNAGSASAYKWEVLGGPPLQSIVSTSESTTSGTFVALTTAGPSIITPRAGDYDVTAETKAWNTTGGGNVMSYDIGATAAVSINGTNIIGGGSSTDSTNQKTEQRQVGLGSTTLTAKYRTSGSGGTSNHLYRRLWLRPVRIS